MSTSSLLQVNEEKYFLIRDGIPVTVKRPNGHTETKKAAVIDFQNPDNNYFLAIKELKIHGDLYRRRTDIVGFVNGIPLLFVELKKNTVDVQNAYDDNYTDYQDTIPHLFYYNAFLMLSNGTEAKVGTLGSKFEFFHEWKRLAEEDQGSVALETMLRGICKKENFLDLFENFILFDHSDGHTAKILARNHQYLGVNEAMKAYAARKLNDGKLGVFWHTQGSGKSYSMVFFAKKVRRKIEGTPTFVILTDRDELNTQISDTFENCGLLGKDIKASQFIATSGDDLIKKLQGNPSFIFTLIQKFNKPNEKPIYPDHDIIIMSDEAHRSQYGIFADNMMKLLPTAHVLDLQVHHYFQVIISLLVHLVDMYLFMTSREPLKMVLLYHFTMRTVEKRLLIYTIPKSRTKFLTLLRTLTLMLTNRISLKPNLPKRYTYSQPSLD